MSSRMHGAPCRWTTLRIAQGYFRPWLWSPPAGAMLTTVGVSSPVSGNEPDCWGSRFILQNSLCSLLQEKQKHLYRCFIPLSTENHVYFLCPAPLSPSVDSFQNAASILSDPFSLSRTDNPSNLSEGIVVAVFPYRISSI